MRERLARELQSLAQEGLISSSGGGRYEIHDVERLRTIAEGLK